MNTRTASRSASKKYQIVQINWFDRTEDRILTETDENLVKAHNTDLKILLLEKFGIDLNLPDFLGRRIGIYFCEDLGIFEETDREDGDCLKVYRQGTPHCLLVLSIIKEFPLIEGKLTPGIYRPESSFSYYEVKDMLDLTYLYSIDLFLHFRFEEYKLVCHEKAIEIVRFEEREGNCYVKIYPFTYFDVCCPFCRKKVVTYEVKSKESPFCNEITDPCEHYAGLAAKINDSYEVESIEDTGLNYRIEENVLYFETSSGWQKAKELIPPQDPENSFYSNSDGIDQDVFLFLECGR